ncbi:MAG: 2'-5' RNA ligase family protein [Solirubrobacterales bacterium]|nr:2'-5' RNA ligase family protein [Solirubrobacterales bacterium]
MNRISSNARNPPFQSILLPVPEVDALVDDFRVEGDWSRGLGVPAHLTLAGPWPLSQELPRKSLSALAVAARGTRYRLDFIDMLGDAICLFPCDDRPLQKWRTRVLSAVGKPDEVSPGWHLHLTICRDKSGDQLNAVREAVDHALPLHCEVRELCIAQLVEPGRAVMESL